jgi:hypothetical protein
VFVDDGYRIGEFAGRVGRSASAVRRWEREKRITVKRTATGQRYFTGADVRAVLGVRGQALLIAGSLSAAGYRYQARGQAWSARLTRWSSFVWPADWLCRAGFARSAAG